MKNVLILFAVCCIQLSIFANNLAVSNLTVAPSSVSFDISWENSWKITGWNYDAIWVFVKYQDCNSLTREWKHAKISPVSGNHSVTGGVLKVDAASDSVGAFIYRNNPGAGNISTANVTLAFPSGFSTAGINFQVFGVEMVYVPQSSYYLGDGNSGAFGNGTPQYITSENTIPANGLVTTHSAIPASFPKGYGAFYCMKYEITQGQYVSFLNTLNFRQQRERTYMAPNNPVRTSVFVLPNYLSGSYANNYSSILASGSSFYTWNPSYSLTNVYSRNSIKIMVPGVAGSNNTPAQYGCDLNNNGVFNEAADGENIACGFLSWDDLTAYLDWSGLRPMTEMEFEKACRGGNLAVTSEYPWGTTTVTASSTINFVGLGIESTSTALGSGTGFARYSTSQSNSTVTTATDATSPMRVGFGTTSTSGRNRAGATYWGIMEMAGNVWEQVVSVLPTGTIRFDGSLGNGELTFDGYSDVQTWPLINGNNLTEAKRKGGGSYSGTTSEMQVSHRGVSMTTIEGVQTRYYYDGGRGVR